MADEWDWGDYESSFGIGSNEPDSITTPWWEETDYLPRMYGGIETDSGYTSLVNTFSGLNPEQASGLYAYAMTLPDDMSDADYFKRLDEWVSTNTPQGPPVATPQSGSGSTETTNPAPDDLKDWDETKGGGTSNPAPDDLKDWDETKGSGGTGASGSGVKPTTSNSSGGGAKPPTGISKLLTDAGLMTDGKVNPLVGLGIAALTRKLGGGSGSASSRPTGYQGGIPQYTATRQQLITPGPLPTTPPSTPTRAPGSAGQRYFSDVTYTKPPPVAAAYGGLMGMAQGRYLSGGTDGMADKIPANIDGKQEARLSHGEFVVPADVVSHLGNGNSEAGAQQLYSMMDRIRKARTGNPKQGKQITPQKFLPR